MRMLMVIVLAVGGLVPSALRVTGQESPPRGRGALDATRQELEQLLSMLEGGNADARADAARIRARLSGGDFRQGDRILLWIDDELEGDTLTVGPGRVLQVPAVGEIPLEGVLHAELEGHLATELKRFFRDPVFRATPLFQVAVNGQVERPGFYLVTGREQIADVLMLAGGPTREGATERSRIERADGSRVEAAAIRAALAAGSTLSDLEVRSGDRIIVPERSGITRREVIRALLVAVPTTLLAIIQLR